MAITLPLSLVEEIITPIPILGIFLFKSRYVEISYERQHISLPHIPEMVVGVRGRFCSLAILMDTGANSGKVFEQHKLCPHIPRPPTSLASSLEPTCLSSILVLNMDARSLTRLLKSTLVSAVK